MLGYKMQAQHYREFLLSQPEKCDEEFMERQIKIYDFLGEQSVADMHELYNSGAFNDYTKAYCEVAAKHIGLTEEQKSQLLQEIKFLHDTITAKQALQQAGYPVE